MMAAAAEARMQALQQQAQQQQLWSVQLGSQPF
jgi:hypothetical protein